VSADTFDVLVIGGGPAGLSGALILARCCRRVALVDDSQPRNRAAAAVHGYLTQDGSSPQYLRQCASQELFRYDVKFYHGEATSLRPHTAADGKGGQSFFDAELTEGLTLRVRKVLIATGVVDELPDLSGLAECFGLTVHHCPYCDGWESRGQKVAVLGKTPRDCVGLALALRTWTTEIMVLTNGRSLSSTEKVRLSENGIEFRESPIRSLLHQAGWLEAIEFEDGSQEECSRCFIDFGHRARANLISELNGGKPSLVPEVDGKQRSAISGLFVAGDVTGGVQMISTAVSEGAIAAIAINRELQDEDEDIRRHAFSHQRSTHHSVADSQPR
jgi:thioredoxin reductase